MTIRAAAKTIGFTKLGFRARARHFSPIDADLKGRTLIVTGATSGIGRSAVGQLAELGASIVIVGRNPDKTARVRDEVITNGAVGEISFEIADLAMMKSVRALGARLLQRNEQIHVLINNAGTLFPDRGITDEGVEQTLATNLLSHFLLTNLLLERMKESAPARIINVSSGGMYTQRIRPGDLQYDKAAYDGSAAYARTKRGQVILTELWAERLAADGIVVHAMHPGWADTPGLKSSLPGFRRLTKPVLRTPAEGADTIVWLAAASEAVESTGRFWLDRQSVPTHFFDSTKETGRDRDLLWLRLGELAGSIC